MNSTRIALLLGLVTACSSTSAKRATTAAHQPVVAEVEDVEDAAAPTAVGEEDDSDSTIVVEPMRIEVIRDAEGNEQVIARDARGLFDEANDALALGEYEAALSLYDDMLADFAESSLSPPALYNAGLALEALGKTDEAVARYLRLANRVGSGDEGIDGRIRAAALLAERERWSESLATLDGMLSLPGLTPSNRLEGMARRGYVLLEAKDYAAAERQLDESIAYYRSKLGKRPVFEDNYYAAMAYFYLGDIPRRQFDAIPIRLPDSQMTRDIEAKASLVLLAGERFGNTVKLGHPYWSTAAGFRLADMKHQFWVSLMRAPIPPQLGQQAATLYVEEVHKHSLSLLQDALSVHGKNVQLATLYNVPTKWSEASAREVVRLTELIGREQAGELVSAAELTGADKVAQGASADYMPSRIDL